MGKSDQNTERHGFDHLDTLTVEGIERTLAKLLDNASQLVTEAQLLFDSGLYPRVVALCQVADEELGKMLILFRVGCELSLGRSVDWKKIRKRLTSHRSKTRTLYSFLWFGHPGLTFDEVLVTNDMSAAVCDNMKKAGLYVTFLGGEPATPSDRLTREEAERALTISTAQVGRFRETEKTRPPIRDHAASGFYKWFSGLDEEQLETFYRTAHERLKLEDDSTEDDGYAPWLEEYRQSQRAAETGHPEGGHTHD